MDQVISPLHFLRGLGMVGLTVVMQAATQIALTWFLQVVPPPKGSGQLNHWGVVYVVAAVVILVLGLIGEVTLWALLYYAWGDLGSFTNCIYFSLASFTTMGASDLALSPLHRIVGTTEAAVGMLMFGWSTALLFDVIQRMRGWHESATN
ncbi:ion channel [Reyranella sp.]|uniref:ion channel n=1 Tax=Reyranella sp. TaxID=1929291 RepID=UPI002F951321